MRILVISNYYPPLEIGGWEQLTRDVSEQLIKRGHQVYVVTSNYRADEITQAEPNVARVLHLESPDHVHYHPRYTLTVRQREQQNRQQLNQVINDFQPDFVFINGMWNLPSTVAQHLEQKYPGRVVYYVASYWPAETDAHTAYWQTPTQKPMLRFPKQIAGTLAQKIFIPNNPRNGLAFEHVLCVSDFMRQYLIKNADIPVHKVHVVYNGIELPLFTMRKLERNISSLKLLYAGRLSPEKGVHTAIESMSYIATLQLDLPVTLTIVGGGAPTYEEQLKKQIVDLNLSDVVHFVGAVPRQEMPKILSDHHVLLLTSVWAEPLARMTQEAMACGLVVIGTTTGGTPEILQNEQNGLTFEAENAAMLANKIAQVAQDSKLRIRLAKAARQTVEERFSFERMVDEIESYLQNLTVAA